MLAGALGRTRRSSRSKAAQSVRSRVCNIRDCLPGDMELREFWAAILAELGRDGLVRESLDEAELAEVRRIAEEKYGSWDWNWGRSPDFGFRVRRRFPAGSLELRLDLHAGRIRDAAIFGDFLALRDCGPAREALLGRRFERGELEEALRGLPLREYFGGIGLEEILGLIFGRMGKMKDLKRLEEIWASYVYEGRLDSSVAAAVASAGRSAARPAWTRTADWAAAWTKLCSAQYARPTARSWRPRCRSCRACSTSSAGRAFSWS